MPVSNTLFSFLAAVRIQENGMGEPLRERPPASAFGDRGTGSDFVPDLNKCWKIGACFYRTGLT